MATLQICPTPNDLKVVTHNLQVEKSEVDGLPALKQNLERFINTEKLDGNLCAKAIEYLEYVLADDALLLNYLQARKYKPDNASNTIIQYVQNRFQVYPEVFPENGVPQKVKELIECHAAGILKNCDKLGRRIVFLDISNWDPKRHTLDHLTTAGVLGCERFWRDEKVLKNGIIMLQNTKGFGMSHFRQHRLQNMMRLRDVFMFSFPVAIKGLYYLNVPSIFATGHRLIRSLFPKKIRNRMFLYSVNETPVELFDVAPPEILPISLGGNLAMEDAVEDMTFFEQNFDMRSV